MCGKLAWRKTLREEFLAAKEERVRVFQKEPARMSVVSLEG